MGNQEKQGRVALVTGGAGDLGLAACMRLAQLGYRVAVADLDGGKSRDKAAGLPGSGHMGTAIDVADETSVARAFAAVESGIGPVAVLVTVAGVIVNGPDGAQSLLADTSLDAWEKTFAVNTRGTFLCIREFARLRARTPVEHGRVITVSSSAAQLGGYQARSAYCASKGAVLSLSKEAARELAPAGITVNSIAPGPMDTALLQAARGPKPAAGNYDALALIPLRRIGQPQEFAAAVAYLASVDAAYITGATLDINGGSRMQ